LLYRGLRRQEIYAPRPGWRSFFARLALALVVMGAALRLAGGSSEEWLSWPLATRLWRLSLLICCGAGVYFATLGLVGFRLADFRRRAAE
jgi:putative peptidoglycan lipid II flippase